MIVHGMFVCSRFLISVCMFIASKALLISSATVIVRAGGAIWLNPFATVLFSVWIGPSSIVSLNNNSSFHGPLGLLLVVVCTPISIVLLRFSSYILLEYTIIYKKIKYFL